MAATAAMPSAGSGGSNVMTTNQRNAAFNEEVRFDVRGT